jgi:hypothetical protein
MMQLPSAGVILDSRKSAIVSTKRLSIWKLRPRMDGLTHLLPRPTAPVLGVLLTDTSVIGIEP